MKKPPARRAFRFVKRDGTAVWVLHNASLVIPFQTKLLAGGFFIR